MSKLVKLGDLGEIKTGPFGTQFRAEEYVESGIPVLNVKNIGYGNVIEDGIEYISPETAGRLSQHILCQGDIVFGRKGSVDRHVYIDAKYDNSFQGSDCIRLRIKRDDVNNRFLSHYLKLDTVKKQLISGAVGSTMPSMNASILANIEVSLPNIETQNAIEQCLSYIDEKTENNSLIDLSLQYQLLHCHDEKEH